MNDMETRKNKSSELFGIIFAAIVLGIIVGGSILQWINKAQADGMFVALAPFLWIGIFVYIVGGTIIEQRKEQKKRKEFEKRELETAKSHGFESWAEYMTVHGTDEQVRKSWEKKATEERKEREERVGKKWWQKQ